MHRSFRASRLAACHPPSSLCPEENACCTHFPSSQHEPVWAEQGARPADHPLLAACNGPFSRLLGRPASVPGQAEGMRCIARVPFSAAPTHLPFRRAVFRFQGHSTTTQSAADAFDLLSVNSEVKTPDMINVRAAAPRARASSHADGLPPRVGPRLEPCSDAPRDRRCCAARRPIGSRVAVRGRVRDAHRQVVRAAPSAQRERHHV